MLLLNNDVVKRVLTMDQTIQVMEDAYMQLARGEAVSRPRVDVRIPTRDPSRTFNWGTMEGGSSTSGYFAFRLKSDILYQEEYLGVRTDEKYCVRPGLYCGLIILVDVHTAEPLAMIHDGYLQNMRVAGGDAIGVKYMARENAQVVGMLGSGGMARAHAEALCRVRNIRKIQVYSPTKEHREAYAQEMSERLEIEVTALDDPRKVFEGADIIAGCTDSTDPVIKGEWLEEGVHIAEVAGSERDGEATRRIDLSLLLGVQPTPIGMPELRFDRRGLYGADLTYQALPPAGVSQDLSPRGKSEERGWRRIPEERVITLESLLAGGALGRTSPTQITHAERGNVQGVQFFSIAARVFELAREQGLGRELPTEWFLQDIRS